MLALSTSQSWYFGETCLHLTEQNKLSGAWSKKEKEEEEKKRTFSFKRREKERRVFAEFFKNQFVNSNSIYVERSKF